MHQNDSSVFDEIDLLLGKLKSKNMNMKELYDENLDTLQRQMKLGIDFSKEVVTIA